MSRTKQELGTVSNSKESLLIAYQQEKELADSVKHEVNELHLMNDRLREANRVFMICLIKFEVILFSLGIS